MVGFELPELLQDTESQDKPTERCPIHVVAPGILRYHTVDRGLLVVFTEVEWVRPALYQRC